MLKLKEEIKGRLVSFVSKKFILSILVFIVATILVIANYISGDHWTVIVTSDIVVYEGSNAISKKYKESKNKVDQI